jgi:hypothetical protein
MQAQKIADLAHRIVAFRICLVDDRIPGIALAGTFLKNLFELIPSGDSLVAGDLLFI